MKKSLVLVLAVVLTLSFASTALAADYSGSIRILESTSSEHYYMPEAYTDLLGKIYLTPNYKVYKTAQSPTPLTDAADKQTLRIQVKNYGYPDAVSSTSESTDLSWTGKRTYLVTRSINYPIYFFNLTSTNYIRGPHTVTAAGRQ